MTTAETISPRQRQLVLLAGLAGALMVTVDTSIANVALPEIQGGLSIAPDQLGWILTSYLIAGAIGTPLTSALVPRFGLGQVLIVSIAGFVLSSIGCGLSTSLPELVLFRTLQGLFGAAMMPSAQMLIYELHPPEELNRAVSLYSMGILVGPVIGPPLGGFLVEIANWRWIFLVNIPFGILSVATLVIFLPKLARIPVRPFDFLGFGLLSIGLLCLQLMLDRGQGKGWFSSAEIVVELSLCVTAFYMFLAHSFTTKHPFLDFTILKDRNFFLATMMTFIVSLISFIPTVVFPLFLQHIRGYNVFDTGLILMPRGLAMVASMLLMSRLPGNLDQRWLVAIGLVMNSVGFFFLGSLTPDYPSSLIIAVSVGTAIGQSIAMLPVQMLAFATMPLELRPMGTSFYNLIRATSVSVGTAIALSYVARSTEDNHVRLLQKLSVYNPLMTGPNMPENVASPLFLKLLSIEIWRQATVIAYNNMFTIGFVLSVIIVPFAFLVREARQARPEAVVTEDREALDVAAGVHA